MLDTYIPVLRNRSNEREVIQKFGGFANFLPNEELDLSLKPLVEVTGSDDLGSLEPFIDAGDEVMVDLPAYQASRDSKFGNAIEETISAQGSRENFYRSHAAEIDYPVLSGLAELPEQYGIHISMQKGLQQTFSTLVHRIMVRRTPLDETQRETLATLAGELRASDRVLFDVVEAGVDDDLLANLQNLSRTFEANTQGVLDIFDAYDGEPENRTPQVAEEFGIEGFGDFSINVRYPGGGGSSETASIVHYHPGRFRTERFEGNSYGEAAAELTTWDKWNATHCDYCRDASTLSPGTPSEWKRVRMGHYITTVLRGDL